MTGTAIPVTDTVTCLAFKPLLALADENAAGEAVRLAIGDLPEPPTLETHVPVSRWLAAWETLEQALPGLVTPLAAAERSHLADFEIFGFLAITAGSLAEAFARVARVRSLWARGSGWRLEEYPDAFELSLSPWRVGSRGAELAREYLLAEMVQSMREIVGKHIVPTQVSYAHDAAVDDDSHHRFFGTEVRFGASRDALKFDKGVATLPVKAFDTRLHDFFRRECDALVERTGSDDWLSRVRRWLAEAHVEGTPSAARLAQAMAVSERTLRRRLNDSGTSFKQQREQVAVELAHSYLRRPGLTSSEVAFLLGFSEPSAFFRAFRRWTGETPRAFQARQRF